MAQVDLAVGETSWPRCLSPFFYGFLLAAAMDATGWARQPVQPFESTAAAAPQGKIDELVFARLKRLGIPPAPICSDAVFVRRVYLDVIGTLPTAAGGAAVPRGPGPATSAAS